MIFRLISFKFIVIITTVLTVFSVSTCFSYAALNIKVSPRDGQNSISFGRVSYDDTNEEIHFRIMSTEGKQYQVFQRLVEPITNEKGEFPTRSVLSASALLGSNSSGTLHLQSEMPLSYNDQLIYTSSQQGLSDDFTLLYQVDQSRIERPGQYLGKVLFVVRSIGNGSRDEQVLSLMLSVPDDFKYDIRTSSGSNRVVFVVEDRPEQKGSYIHLTYFGFRGEGLKVSQKLIAPLRNEQLEELDLALIKIDVFSDQNAQGVLSSSPELNYVEEVIFQSSMSQDELRLALWIDEKAEKSIKAGKYVGLLQLILESNGNKIIEDIEIEISVPPLFQLVFDFPEKGMKFTRVMPETPPQQKEVVVTVYTNMYKPYMVTQKAQYGLVNEDGHEMRNKNFQMKGEVVQGYSGKIESSEYSSFPISETPIFVSDGEGAPSQFKMSYRLTPYWEMKPGNYMTSIVYSLSEL